MVFVVVQVFLKVIVTVMAPLDALGYVAETVLLMLMRTAFVMTLTTVLALMTIVECVGPGAIYECGCSDIPEETVTVMATYLML